MREIALEEDAIKLAENDGWYQRKVVFVGVKGSPDRWFFKRGHLLIVEFKRRGEKPDGNQVKRHRELRAAGFKVHVLDTIEGFIKTLMAANQEIAARAV